MKWQWEYSSIFLCHVSMPFKFITSRHFFFSFFRSMLYRTAIRANGATMLFASLTVTPKPPNVRENAVPWEFTEWMDLLLTTLYFYSVFRERSFYIRFTHTHTQTQFVFSIHTHTGNDKCSIWIACPSKQPLFKLILHDGTEKNMLFKPRKENNCRHAVTKVREMTMKI